MDASWKKALGYYVIFLKIGSMTFGGGLNIIAQIRKRYVEDERCFTDEELLDTFCIGKSLPGTMVTNVAYLFGYQNGGILCGMACVLGLVTAPAVILALVAIFYDAVRNSAVIAQALAGVRAAVVPIILAAVLKMLKSAFPHAACVPVALAAFILFYFLNLNSLLVVLLGGVCGLAIYPAVQRAQAEKEAEP